MKPVDEAVSEYLAAARIPRRVRELIKKARFDLYYGPYPVAEEESGLNEVPYPGFPAAVAEIRDGIENLDTIYVDTGSGCWQTEEPQPYEDGGLVFPTEYVAVDAGYLKVRLCGRELAAYV